MSGDPMPWYEAPEPVIAEEVRRAVDERDREELPAEIAVRVQAVPALYRDPDAVRAFARALREEVVDRVRATFDGVHHRRSAGRVTEERLAPELRVVGDLVDALAAVRDAIDAGVTEGRQIAGELMLELKPDLERGGSGSVRVGALGSDLKVTHTQPTKAYVEEDEVVDVLVASLIAETVDDGSAWPSTAAAFASGLRAGIAALRALQTTSVTAWKTSALDELKRDLEAREEYPLAIRLGHAYGRASHGKASTKIERVAPKTTTAEETS